MQIAGLILLGLIAGVLGGMTGIGGGVIIVPALIYLFGYSAHLAQGTTLALLVPPIGLLAALEYDRKGYGDVVAALLIAASFVAGIFLGTRLSIWFSEDTTRKVFAVCIGMIAAHMFLHQA